MRGTYNVNFVNSVTVFSREIGIHCSAIHSIDWWLVTDISAEPIGLMYKIPETSVTNYR